MNNLPIGNSKHIESINSTTGQAVNAGPCIVYSLTLDSDTGATGIVTLHDGASQTATKIFEAKVAANGTPHFSFPKGKRFNTGCWVKSNVTGLGLSIDYD